MSSRYTTSGKTVSIGKLILSPMILVRNQVRNMTGGDTGKFIFGRININLGLRAIRIPYGAIYWYCILDGCGPGSSVGVATYYGLDGPGSNSGGDEIFRSSRPLLRPTQPPVKWVPGLSRG